MAEALAESARKTRVILNGPDLAAQIQRPCSGWMLSGTGIICKSQDHACNSPNNELGLRATEFLHSIKYSTLL